MPSTRQSETVLVTGAAGFIGLHLCRALLNRGDQVIAVDNFWTGSRSGLAALADASQGRVLVVEHDIQRPFPFPFPEMHRIINLACPASPRHYGRSPLGTLRSSVVGVVNMLDVAHARSVPFLQASTSEVYGDPTEATQRENLPGFVDSMSERACYVEGKRVAEVFCTLYRETFDVSTRIARIFNSYGPGMLANDGRVVSSFISQALDGRPLTVYGDGTQTRSLCFVTDTVRGLLAMADHPTAIPYPINIGNPDEIEIRDLAWEIARLARPDTSSEITFSPTPQGEPRRRCPDITRARRLLSWEPAVPRDEGLRRTVDWFIHHRER